MSDERKRPVNVSAERAVLAGICQYGNSVFSDISEIINHDCFSATDSQILFKCAENILAGSDSVDISSILSTATSLGYGDLVSKKDMADYIKSIFLFAVNKENVRKNAIVLRKLQIARKAQDVVKNIWLDLSNVTGTEPIGQLITKIEGPVLGLDFGADNNEDSTKKIGDSGDEIFSQLEALDGKTIGIPSPWAKYNQTIGGGRRPGYIYLIGARPKTCKTQVAINDALFVAEKCKIPVLIADTEMNVVDMTTRMWANLSNIPTNDIDTGKFKFNDFSRNQVLDAKERMKNMPLSYRRIAGKPFEEVLSIIRKWVTQDVGLINGKAKPCLLIYDYFKLMDSTVLENMQEYQALGFQLNDLSNFIGKYQVPCSAYVQLSRAGIDKDTSDALSQSDRLLWLCASVALLKRKSAEEIALDGAENGNIKLIVTPDQRFGEGMDENNYINLKAQLDRCIIEEGLTRFELKSKPKSEGFEIIDDEDTQDNFSDKDFDEPASAYRDESYRKTYTN